MTVELTFDDIVAVIWTDGNSEAFEPTLLSLKRAHPELEIVVGYRGLGGDRLADLGAVPEQIDSLSSLIALAGHEWKRHVLLITSPVIVPPGLLENALLAVDDDLRISTISFMSNAAGYLSLPHRNSPGSHQVGSQDEVSITRVLRTVPPHATIVPIPVPAGGITLLSHFALGACDGFSDLPESAASLVVDFALRAAGRGFVSVVDGATYVTRATDLLPLVGEPLDDRESIEYGRLSVRYPFIAEVYDHAKTWNDSPIALNVQVSSTKVRGLRIIVDGSDLGPKEMGTQVSILALVRGLAARDDVDSIQVALPGALPAYAEPFLRSSKIRTFLAHGLDMMGADYADVIHRPAQPSSRIPFDNWRSKAARIVVTLQDLIAYQVGAYSGGGAAWLRYRTELAAASAAADGVIVISHDTLRQVRRENLPIEPNRLFVVQTGSDHLSGVEEKVIPSELARRGFRGEEFILVLGTNYGHKNRDLAIRAWKLLQGTYPQLHLVLVGAFVPSGSSRLAESRAQSGHETLVHVIPDVTSAERNWLLSHASVLLYPTSAEGFGLVPFEAARFGTPTVGVSFGPLAEVNPGVPVSASSWMASDIASAAGQMLADPAVAQEQIRITSSNSAEYIWSETARGLAEAYRTLLSLPGRAATN